MKYLKLFEELRPETYISAGQKLKKKGHNKRGDNLINYATSLRDMKDEPYDKNIFKYNILSSETIYKCKLLDYKVSLMNGFKKTDSVAEVIDGDGAVVFNVSFDFETNQGMILKPFELKIILYTGKINYERSVDVTGRVSSNKKRVVRNYIQLIYSNYDGELDCIMQGLFADRRSAILFIREILSTIPNDSDFVASEVVSLMQRPNEELEDIYNMFTINNIDVHTLYSDNENVLEENPIITKNDN